jgi:hypothetical protein
MSKVEKKPPYWPSSSSWPPTDGSYITHVLEDMNTPKYVLSNGNEVFMNILTQKQEEDKLYENFCCYCGTETSVYSQCCGSCARKCSLGTRF